MQTPRQANIDYLVGLGFEICPWEVTYYKYAGSTQLGMDPHFNFYVGEDYVFGSHSFFQDWQDMRLIDDTIILLALSAGLELPSIEEDSEIEGHYFIIGFQGNKSEPVYHQVAELEKLIREKFNSIPPSEELSEYYSEFLGDRFLGHIFEVLQPVPPMDEASEIYAQREARDRRELTDQLAHLIHAVDINVPQMYASIIDRVNFLGIKCHYDPEQAIRNIISQKYHLIPE